MDAIRLALKKDSLSQDEKEMREFWVIVGLLECGELAKAREAIGKFKPRDMRLLVAIHLGCFLTMHIKITNKPEKVIAADIVKTIGQQVAFLREQIIAEWKSELSQRSWT